MLRHIIIKLTKTKDNRENVKNNKGETKTFSDKQMLREFSTTKPALQQILNGLV